MPTLLPGKNRAFHHQYQVVGMPEMAALIKAITNARLKKVPLAMEASGDVSQKPWSFVVLKKRRPSLRICGLSTRRQRVLGFSQTSHQPILRTFVKGLEMNLGTLLVLSLAFSASRSFSRLPLSLTCPDPSAFLHHAEHVSGLFVFFFFSPAFNFSLFLSTQAMSGSLNVYWRDRWPTCARVRPNYSALTKVRSFYSRSRLNQNE